MTARSLTAEPGVDRAAELFHEHQEEIYRNTDQLFARLENEWNSGLPPSWADASLASAAFAT